MISLDAFNIHIKKRMLRQPGCIIQVGGESLTGRSVYTQHPTSTTGLAVVKSEVVRVRKIDSGIWEIEPMEAIA